MTDTDPYLSLLVDAQCENCPGDDEVEYQDDIDALPQQFLYRVMMRMRVMKGSLTGLRSLSWYSEEVIELMEKSREPENKGAESW